MLQTRRKGVPDAKKIKVHRRNAVHFFRRKMDKSLKNQSETSDFYLILRDFLRILNLIFSSQTNRFGLQYSGISTSNTPISVEFIITHLYKLVKFFRENRRTKNSFRFFPQNPLTNREQRSIMVAENAINK